MDLSFVIPCFEEAPTIGPCVEAVLARLDRGAGEIGEVVVVDDGSTDGTSVRVEALAARRPEVRLVRLPRNRGKGAAVRAGVLATRGDVVVVLDADLAVEPGHVDRMLPLLSAGADVVIGCRHVEGARVERRQGRVRRRLGRAYLRLARRVLALPVSDVTCGFKGFRRAVALDLFRATRCRRWGIDAEVLLLAAQGGYRVEEVPVTWRDGSTSRVRLVRDVLGSLAELVTARRSAARGDAPRKGARRSAPALDRSRGAGDRVATP